jgi:hypothetical protein
MAMRGTPYLTPEEFRTLITGLDVSDIDDLVLLDHIRQASRIADSYIGGSFDVEAVSQRQGWKDSRRFYPKNVPVNAVRRLTLFIGAGVSADLRPRDLFVNNDENYVEVVSLATTVGLSGELISLGMNTVVAEMVYNTGYGEFEDVGLTLDGDVTAAALSFTVAESYDAPALSAGDLLRIDSELVWVDAVVDQTAIVTRDVNTNGTFAAAHADDAVVEVLIVSVPDEVKVAIAMIVGAIIAAARQQAEGATGVRSYMIGSYSVSFGRGIVDYGTAGFPYVPDLAGQILDSYRLIVLR